MRSVAWHPVTSVMASGSKDCLVKLWDARAGPPSIATIHGHKGIITNVSPPLLSSPPPLLFSPLVCFTVHSIASSSMFCHPLSCLLFYVLPSTLLPPSMFLPSTPLPPLLCFAITLLPPPLLSHSLSCLLFCISLSTRLHPLLKFAVHVASSYDAARSPLLLRLLSDLSTNDLSINDLFMSF